MSVNKSLVKNLLLLISVGIYLRYCLFGCIVRYFFLKNLLEIFQGCITVYLSRYCVVNFRRKLTTFAIDYIFSTQRIYTSTINLCRQALFSNFSKLFILRNLKSGKKKKSQSLKILLKRRKRDLNPRAALATYTLSRGASSAS